MDQSSSANFCWSSCLQLCDLTALGCVSFFRRLKKKKKVKIVLLYKDLKESRSVQSDRGLMGSSILAAHSCGVGGTVGPSHRSLPP